MLNSKNSTLPCEFTFFFASSLRGVYSCHFPAIPESSCPGQGRTEFLAQNFEINFFADDLVDRSPCGALPEIECRLGAPKREKSRRVSLFPSVRAASQHVGRPFAYVVTVVRFFDLVFRGF